MTECVWNECGLSECDIDWMTMTVTLRVCLQPTEFSPRLIEPILLLSGTERGIAGSKSEAKTNNRGK